MLGIKYSRIKKGLARAVVAAALDVHPCVIQHMESDTECNISAANYEKMADYFGVTVEELIRDDYPELGIKSCYDVSTDGFLRGFMHENAFFMRALGKALGVSRQTILNCCSDGRQAEKYYQKLADIEGISLESLVERYSQDVKDEV